MFALAVVVALVISVASSRCDHDANVPVPKPRAEAEPLAKVVAVDVNEAPTHSAIAACMLAGHAAMFDAEGTLIGCAPLAEADTWRTATCGAKGSTKKGKPVAGCGR